MKTRLVRYNPRRRARGVEAAEVEIDGEEEGVAPLRLWMSQADIRNNIAQFGQLEGFVAALEAYRQNQPFPA